ncbi:MAG: hypothetical protein ACOYVG_08935 [Bacteroidota bacterium]
MIDINSIDQGQVYMLYEVFKNIETNLESKIDKSEEDNVKLANCKAQLTIIEQWAQNKMADNLHWTAEEILLRFGHRPTLIIEFHPGTDGYATFGKEIVANVEFDEERIQELLSNIQNKVPRKPSTIRFMQVSDMTWHEVSTANIFELGGRR